MNESNPPKIATESDWEVLERTVSAAQDGDPMAFEQLVDRTENLVKRIAYPIVGQTACDDVAQDTFLQVFKYIGKLSEPKAFIGWLSRIALHSSYQYQNKNRAETELPESASVADNSEAVVNSLALRRALARLPKHHRNILILREMLELSYDDISVALQIPMGTVKSRLNKAKKLLSQRMLRWKG